jgi:hypothetical protein
LTAASDARVSRRLRMRMMQRRIKKLKSRRIGSRRMRGGNLMHVPQHGESCVPGQLNCPGNIAQSILSTQAQANANSHGDNPNPQQ